jgi:hypothetical protein
MAKQQRATTTIHSGIINSINETESNLNKMGLVERVNVTAKKPKSLENMSNKKKNETNSGDSDRQQLMLKEEFEQKLMQGALAVTSKVEQH